MVEFVVDALWNAANTRVDYTVRVINHGSTTQNLTGVAVQIVTTTSGSQDPATGQTEATDTIGSVTVSGNSEVTRTGSFTITRNSSKIYWVKGYADNFVTSGYNQIEDNPD